MDVDQLSASLSNITLTSLEREHRTSPAIPPSPSGACAAPASTSTPSTPVSICKPESTSESLSHALHSSSTFALEEVEFGPSTGMFLFAEGCILVVYGVICPILVLFMGDWLGWESLVSGMVGMWMVWRQGRALLWLAYLLSSGMHLASKSLLWNPYWWLTRKPLVCKWLMWTCMVWVRLAVLVTWMGVCWAGGNWEGVGRVWDDVYVFVADGVAEVAKWAPILIEWGGEVGMDVWRWLQWWGGVRNEGGDICGVVDWVQVLGGVPR